MNLSIPAGIYRIKSPPALKRLNNEIIPHLSLKDCPHVFLVTERIRTPALPLPGPARPSSQGQVPQDSCYLAVLWAGKAKCSALLGCLNLTTQNCLFGLILGDF